MYGKTPYSVSVVHGGPGAAGDMAPVAVRLSAICGVLEPMQTADSVRGQITELQTILEGQGDVPHILIGHSWGAWLSWMTAASHPDLVKKLILVSSGPFDEIHAKAVQSVRMDRLGTKQQKEALHVLSVLSETDHPEADALFARFGKIISRADAYDPIDAEEDVICRYDIFRKVWREASGMRRSGRLLDLAGCIRCPVVAIHGDYDPHPAEGVRNPLSKSLGMFRFILLEKCGHKPWIEKQAKERFFKILRDELH